MATRSRPEPELVEVFGSKEESEVFVVSGLLETAGIDCLVTALDAPQDILPGVGGSVIRVPAEQAEEARRLIEEYRRNPATDEDELISEQEEGEGGNSPDSA